MTVITSPGHIKAHAGLRGIAALLVVAYHLQFATERLPVEDWTLFFKRSYLLVDLFFVLSGFIISLTNEKYFRDGVNIGNYGQFMGRRLARLYPLLAFTLLYLFMGHYLLNGVYRLAGRPAPLGAEDPIILIAQMTLTNAWLPHPEGWNLPSWSISAEMSAYLLFPLLITISRSKSWPSRLVLLLIALPYYLIVAWTTHSLDVIGGTAPFRCLAGFSTGMLVYQFRDWFAMKRVPLAMLQLISVGAISLMLSIRVNDVWLIPFFAALVGTTWQDRGPVGYVLSKSALVWLGTISYSVYLNHFGALSLLGAPWRSMERMLGVDPVFARIAWIIFSAVTVIALSSATYRWIEIPGRKWFGQRLLRVRLQPITASPPGP